MKVCVTFLAVLIFAHANAAELSGPQYAARLGTLSQIASEVGKYPHPKSEFFQSACLLTELRRILGSDYELFCEHLSSSGAGALEKEGGYVCGDVSALHVGGYGSLFYLDVTTQKMYLFWLKATVLEKKYQIYGDRPIPAPVLSSIAKHMNEGWGHVGTFRFVGERLVIENLKEKEPNKNVATNRSKPVRAETNLTSSAASSRR